MGMPSSEPTSEQRKAIDGAIRSVARLLAMAGLEAEAQCEDLPERCLGQYEGGSVFEKTVRVSICPGTIRTFCHKASSDIFVTDIRRQTRLTVLHEVAHALVEQIRDWVENVPEVMEFVRKKLFGKYPDVFDIRTDIDEELVCEDFAYGFRTGRGNHLESSWKQLCRFINQNS